MKFGSITLSGNSSSIIADAISSVVDVVDVVILIDTGISDDTIQKASLAAKGKLVIKKFAWINDFSAARNYALEAAKEEGCDWAIMLDTDERIIWNDENLTAILNSNTEDKRKFDVVMVNSVDDSYSKERIFRIPVREKYFGPTHETFPVYKVGGLIAKRLKFVELPKSDEQYRKKFTRDLQILEKHVLENPKDPRWFYYLGDTNKNLGRFKEAIHAYDACYRINGWDEESAWACYRIAECFVALKDLQSALDACARGIGRHPGIGELYWLAGWLCFQMNQFSKAEYWSYQAISAGFQEGFASKVFRIGFRHPIGLYDGPYDVLRWSLLKQNKPVSEELQSKLVKAMEARTNGIKAVTGI